ncbi:5'-methylthioadenosine/S-adenosylhomocysteine nucleosidase [Mycobacterium sp. DL592]|uniref:5'-methylthioadenosine/S-adenosylhomocysteine nucleosidase n=1 Tax=Mycobacterium sp. DL592 TaxID=2675524 RepID=UPI001AAFD39A|nr:5'-methylthioadenosine/S-adenosylhomocysteine nucleosidase [Mycobacterium sp. DL592]
MGTTVRSSSRGWLWVVAVAAGVGAGLLAWPATAAAETGPSSTTAHHASSGQADRQPTPSRPTQFTRPATAGAAHSARRTPRQAVSDPTTVDNAGPAGQPEKRTLILSAFPAETDAILARTTLDPTPSVVVDGAHFYFGEMGGKKVIVAMTGIGMVNATRTTTTAFEHFTAETGTTIGAVVFSGVAGGFAGAQIGSVTVPARWTADDGATWHPVDPGLLATAGAVSVDLLSSDSIGDPACPCSGLTSGLRIDLGRKPAVVVGGDGASDDNNGGTAFPAIPLGGAVFGPQPCGAPDYSPLSTGNFVRAIGPFLARGLISNITGLLTNTNPPVDAVDQETAAAQQVADAYGVPFLGIRGISDGAGDPLNLPGIPFLQFFVYRQIAADNAAIVTEALLGHWAGA